MALHDGSSSNPKDLENRNYTRYHPELEHIPPSEVEDIQAVADMINAMQKKQFNNHHHTFGGTLIPCLASFNKTIALINNQERMLERKDSSKESLLYRMIFRNT